MNNKFEKQNSVNVSGIRIFPHNDVLDLGAGYISYAWDFNETAVVLIGADGNGVMFLVIDGDKRKEVEKVIEEYSHEKWNKDGLLGEIIAWACKHRDFNVKRSSIGRLDSRCGLSEIQPCFV